MPSTCRFELNKSNATYFSGENIAGTITLNTTSNKNVRDVSIIFLGEGKVKWQESHSSTDSDGHSTTQTTYYRSHEVYISNTTMVHGYGVLPLGQHTYTFRIPLPLECPTSIEGKYGHVRYEISLKINRVLRFDNVFKMPVTIIKTIDLNLTPIYKIPLVHETVNSLCCWPCSRGKIFYTLKVPFGAYAPGQLVKYALHIGNQSTDDIEGYFLQFTKKIIFTAKSPRRKERSSKHILVDQNFYERCLRLTNRITEGQFHIPSTPPTSPRSSIICVEYKLKVTLQLSGCSSSPEIEIPITIGTIPIRESLLSSTSCTEQEQAVPTAPSLLEDNDPKISGDSPPTYAELKPPSFEEATRCSTPFIDTDIDERNRMVDFKPLYPIYNMPQTF